MLPKFFKALFAINSAFAMLSPWLWIAGFTALRLTGVINGKHDWLVGTGIFVLLLAVMAITGVIVFGQDRE